MTMKAVLKARDDVGAELQTVPIPEIKPWEVLVRVRATSICGTDVHLYQWDRWARGRIGPRVPQVLGHEMAGEVVAVGAHCRRIRVGDYVSAETHIYDPMDVPALVGQWHVGDRMQILGVDRDGCFAEYIAIPESVAWVNDASIPPEVASIQEPLGNAVYTVLGEDGDIAGKTVAILGDGPIGLFAVAVARLCGATTIFLTGMSDIGIGLGATLGADHLIRADEGDAESRAAFVREHTRGAGADVVLEMVGAPSAVREGFAYLRRGGRYSAFGLSAGEEIPIDYNNAIVFKGAQIQGISGRRIFDTWYRVRNFLSSGRLDVRPVITHLYPLDEFERGFAGMMANPRVAMKVVLFPERGEYERAVARHESRS